MDLCVHTNQPNVYFDGGYVKLQYDSSVFGPNIVNSGNLDVSLCPEFQNGSYTIHAVYDTSTNNVKVLGGIAFVNTLQRVLLDTTPKPFLHLSFSVTLDSFPHKVVFLTHSTAGAPTYTHTANTSYMSYFNFNQIVHTPSDTLTIRGRNFGNAKGEVFFMAADDGGQSYLRGLDDQYHIAWTDTLIKVIVPSMVYKGYENESKNWSGAPVQGLSKSRRPTGTQR